MDRAIDECITGGLLEEFLKKHKAEAKEMSIFEYDQEKHMRQERKLPGKTDMPPELRKAVPPESRRDVPLRQKKPQNGCPQWG